MSRLGRVVLVLVFALTLAAIPSAASASAHQGTWRGTTAQGRGINFRVNAYERITYLAMNIEVKGFSCSAVITWKFTGSVQIRPDGYFTVKGTSGIDSLTVKGHFLSKFRAEGTAQSTVFSPCYATGKTTWVAKRVLQAWCYTTGWATWVARRPVSESAGGDQGHARECRHDAEDLGSQEPLVKEPAR